MPELPEVETIRRMLDEVLTDKKVKEIIVLEEKQFHGNPKDIIGKTVTDVLRTGKILTIVLGDKDKKYINIHLKMSGQILFTENKNQAKFKNLIPLANSHTLPAKTTRIILEFTNDSALYFNDMRKFGWFKIGDKPEKPKAVDVLSPTFTFAYFQNALHNTARPIKVVLMDQDRMAGIGNIYANDALFNAQINPTKAAKSLSEDEQKKLYRSILDTIKEGIHYKGSSAHDELYVLPDSEKGGYQNHFKVYHRDGDPCRVCGTTIVKIRLGGRGTFFCPSCQK